jgi:predicted metalloprotease with PDZ domain
MTMTTLKQLLFTLAILAVVALTNSSLVSNAYAQARTHLSEADIRYQVEPIFERGDLKSLRIHMSFYGQRSGKTTVYLPDVYAGQSELWRQIGAPRVTGGVLASPSPARWEITHRPSARIRVTYELTSAYDTEPDMLSTMAKPFRPIVRPQWFSLIGSTTFARLNVDDKTPIRFAWRNFPKEWRVASDLEHDNVDADDLMNSTLMGGRALRVMTVGTSRSRIAIYGQLNSISDEQLQSDFAKLSAAQKAIFGDDDRPFFFSLATLPNSDGSSYQLGTGLGDDAFAAWVLSTTSRLDMYWILSHEHLHAWLPRQVGDIDMTLNPIASYWFSEGFTNFYTARALVRSGLWTPEDWINHWNEVNTEYQSSPARFLKASETVDRFWTDSIVRELPYQRGALIALTIDQRIKDATNHTKSLDDVLILMRTKARLGKKYAPELLIESVKEIAGFDVSGLINDVAINGQAIDFPTQGWRACINVQETARPIFDVGFDRERTATANNVFTGVREDGPAYRAGIRNGMKIIKRTAGKLGNTTLPIAYEVEISPGNVKTFTWLAAGPTRTIQSLGPGPDLSLTAPTAERNACVKLLGGA